MIFAGYVGISIVNIIKMNSTRYTISMNLMRIILKLKILTRGTYVIYEGKKTLCSGTKMSI